MQFDLNQKFKNTINNIKDARELRAQPIGRDKFGNDYWCTLDEKCNIRVFQENVDDETWKIVAGYEFPFLPNIRALHGSPMGDPFKNGKPMGTHGYPFGIL
jgi:hypothetical protein